MNDLAIPQDRQRPMISADEVNPISMMFDPTISDRVKAIAQTMAQGKVTVPEHLRNNMPDCLAVVMQSASWRLNPFAVAQKTHLVQGKLGYEAQLVSAIVSSLGLLEGRFRYEYIGDWSKVAKRPKIVKSSRGFDVPTPGWNDADEEGLCVRVIGKLVGDDERRDHKVWLVQAWPRNSTLWAVNPQQQLGYLAVKQWVRKYAPDAILGVYTPDELQQQHEERPVQGSVVNDADSYVSVTGALSAPAGERPLAQAAPERPQGASAPEPNPSPAPDHAAEPQAGGEAQQAPAALDLEKRSGSATKPRPPEPSDEAEWPKVNPDTGELVDIQGCPWLEEVHSEGKSCTKDGYWRRKRGVLPQQAAAAEKAALDARSSQPEQPAAQPSSPAPTEHSAPQQQMDGLGTPSPMAARFQERINELYDATDVDGLTWLIDEVDGAAQNGNITRPEYDALLSRATDALDAL